MPRFYLFVQGGKINKNMEIYIFFAFFSVSKQASISSMVCIFASFSTRKRA